MEVWVLIFFCAVAVIYFAIKRFFKKHLSNRWQIAVESAGYRFEEANDAILKRFKGFKILSEAPHRSQYRNVRDIVRGQKGGGEFFVFRFIMQMRSRVIKRVVALTHRELHLPHIYCTASRAFFDSLYKDLGKQDINFADDSEFSQAYVLYGENEEKIRTIFNPAVRGWFLKHRRQRLTFEARGKTIMVSRERRITPETAFQLKDELAELLRLLRHPDNRTGSNRTGSGLDF